ncbi:MAG: hypothetical protein F4126_11595 [Acidimicrobiaceae bacterium]|nr:hypothetical protein [Acidimicrobiaceae bacterium]MYB87676.1 hypothetical protein [Acidimicrobiaceae bacterium]MYH94342.1 hypothetical protein [Acidimicrobiaceae bacterium]
MPVRGRRAHKAPSPSPPVPNRHPCSAVLLWFLAGSLVPTSSRRLAVGCPLRLYGFGDAAVVAEHLLGA